LALIDAGAGLGKASILENIRAHGFALESIEYLFLTHLHADHAGGAAGLREAMPHLKVLTAKDMAFALREADEKAIGLEAGKKGGYYEADYRFEKCPVDLELVEGQVVQVGSMAVKAWETPGHCAGHLTFVMEDAGQTVMFSGDNLFFGGKILLQPLPDCDLQLHIRSLAKFAGWGIDVFLPGHGCFSLKNGQRHIDEALSWPERCLVPQSFL
jgi:glyoxylase-like metal-dependent hydrolase (beta-lactamase superfamily II)